MRRLPVYILIETAGGMRGERIQAVTNGLEVMVSSLRQNPFALESVYISLITFNKDAKTITPLTSLDAIQIPDISIPISSPPHTGQALEYLCDQVDKDLIKNNGDEKGDWRPLLFILTRGVPADKQKYHNVISLVKNKNFATIVACSAGSTKSESELKLLTEHIVHLETADKNTLSSFFNWVSSSIGVGNLSSSSNSSVNLPPPPKEVQIVL